jgi:hypothetical protein
MASAIVGRVHPPVEAGNWRQSRLAVEVLDAVTLERVSQGLSVTAEGIDGQPIVSASGWFVWLLPRTGMPVPTRVMVDPGRLPYRPVESAVPPVNPNEVAVVSLTLAPSRNYSFSAGVAGVRATLVNDRLANPVQPLVGVDVWLEWIDDNQPGTVWVAAPTVVKTDDAGDFAAIVRLAPDQLPRLDANGQLRVRLAAIHGPTQYSPELSIPPGRIVDPVDPAAPTGPFFQWTQFTP